MSLRQWTLVLCWSAAALYVVGWKLLWCEILAPQTPTERWAWARSLIKPTLCVAVFEVLWFLSWEEFFREWQ